jgi:hypothetical protein
MEAKRKMAKFSRRHYRAIAEVILNSQSDKYVVAENLAKMFAEDNERFDFRKFAKACGTAI